jgi:hypothetical protein
MTRAALVWGIVMGGFAAVATAGCGGAHESCSPTCRAGYECYYGVCLPAVGDAGAEGGAEGDGPAEVRPEAEAPGDVPGEAPGDDVAPPPDGPTPVGHDEDGDGRDDGCDVCPTWIDPAQGNGDADGVGDVCEAPGREELLSVIEAFDPFLPTTGPSPEWIPQGGDWTPVPDALRGTSRPYGGVYLHTVTVGAPYAVEAVFRYPEAPGGGAGYAGVVFSAREEMGRMRWWTCLFSRTERQLSLWKNEGMGMAMYVASTPGVESEGVDAGAWRRVRVVFEAGEVRCAFGNEIGDAGDVSASGLSLWPNMSGTGGLRVYNETAEFLSYVVYR